MRIEHSVRVDVKKIYENINNITLLAAFVLENIMFSLKYFSKM